MRIPTSKQQRSEFFSLAAGCLILCGYTAWMTNGKASYFPSTPKNPPVTKVQDKPKELEKTFKPIQ